MVTHSGNFPGKILLFGEYTILLGESALSVPYERVSGRLDFISSPADSEQTGSNDKLWNFYNYLLQSKRAVSLKMKLEEFEKDLKNGLYFNSTIPPNYGLGSSGALVAAIYDRYAFTPKKKLNYAELKLILAEMESYFHGNSSGIDPLICLTKKPLVINNTIRPVRLNNKINNSFFLLDTGFQRSTSDFVTIFKKKTTLEPFSERIQYSLVKANNEAINAYMKNDLQTVNSKMKIISTIQYETFAEMIPESVMSYWKAGIETDKYYLKLCGAGGGGYLLGFSLAGRLTPTCFKIQFIGNS